MKGRKLKRKGLDFERKIKKIFEEKGYYVVRSAGSRGVADLVALNKEEKLLIACKKTGNLTVNAKNRLVETAKKINGTPILAFEEEGRVKTIILTEKKVNRQH